MYFVSGKFLALPVQCFLGFSFFAFFIVLFALVIRKAGTWPIDYLFLYCLKRVRAPTLSFSWAGKHWSKVDRKTLDVPHCANAAKSRALR